MPWMPGIPSDLGECPQGTLRPTGVVAHRTYGSWNGDYGVGKGSRCPVGFHFLVGPDPGQWCQFYSTDTRCAHAGTNANGNDISVGIEVSGTNDDPMTPWQVERCRDILNWLEQAHGIALEYRFSTAHDLRADHGVIPHSAVAGADHSDYWTVDDWNRITRTPTRKGYPLMIFISRPDGAVYMVSEAALTSRVGIASSQDLTELQAAVDDPGHVATVSEGTWDEIVRVT